MNEQLYKNYNNIFFQEHQLFALSTYMIKVSEKFCMTEFFLC